MKVHVEKSLLPHKVVRFRLAGIIQAERYPTGMKDRIQCKIFDIHCFHKYIVTVQTKVLISEEV